MIELRKGDVFATNLGGCLGSLIKCGERIHSQDGQACFSHAGIILDWEGTTFEALWTVKRQDFWKAYHGVDVLVARWKGMDDEAFERGWNVVKQLEGKRYPWFRLFLHALNLAKIHIKNRLVCSELTALFLMQAGAQTMNGKNPYGVTPDELVDEWRISKHFTIIYEGKI